jgi:hypothetical protein
MTLLHPETSCKVSIEQLNTKCNLFQNNPLFTGNSYQVRSVASLPIFRDFVSALEGNPIEITAFNVAGLLRLSQEFGFGELRSNLLKFGRWQVNLTSLNGTLFDDSFDFVVNGTTIKSNIREAAALSPAIREQLSVDACARQFVLSDDRIAVSNFNSLQSFLSGNSIPVGDSVLFLSQFLKNDALERLFLDCLISGTHATLSKLPINTFVDLDSANISILSLEMLEFSPFK